MLIAEKSIACRTRWATSSMIPNASCASTSKGIRSSSRASVISSMTRMDSLPRSTKAWAKWWDTKRERWLYEWNQNGTFKAVKLPHRTNWEELSRDKFLDGVGNQGSHFNIRPIKNTRTGQLAGTLEHYNY